MPFRIPCDIRSAAVANVP